MMEATARTQRVYQGECRRKETEAAAIDSQEDHRRIVVIG